MQRKEPAFNDTLNEIQQAEECDRYTEFLWAISSELSKSKYANDSWC